MDTREKTKAALKEDAKNLLEEMRDAEEGETFHKIFTRETSKGTHKVLHYSKEDLHKISCREDDESMHHLKKHEAGDVRMLVRYQSHLIVK